MLWYEETIAKMEAGKIYTFQSLVSELKHYKSDLSTNSYSWLINNMVKSGKIIKIG